MLVAGLGIAGLGVEGRLAPTSLAVPGTPSAYGQALLRRHFGDSAPFVILLRGPAAAVDRQGPGLVRTLRRQAGATALSPWDPEALARLRPRPTEALVLVDFAVDEQTAVRETVPEMDRILAARIHLPVEASQTGFATLSRAIQDESVRSTRIAEIVAVPILILVLLLVFRSPVAAAVPLAFGGAAVISARGVLAIAASQLRIDGFSLTVASMMGLALGVDYSLLAVSRFREELAVGRSPWDAAARTRRTAGRTASFAGGTLILAMLMTLWVMPGNLFLSLAATAVLVTAISVAIAALVAPPLLFLLGHGVDRWRLGGSGGGRRLMGMVGAALARPRLAACLIGAALVALALPAAGLSTGPPSAAQLPNSNQVRREAEAIGAAVGPGWDAPFVLVAGSEHGPVTAAPRLTALRRAQRRIASDPAVQAVIGPGGVERRVAPLRRSGRRLLAEKGPTSPRRLTLLGDRLGRADLGVGQLRRGIAEASAGAGLLASGSDRAGGGAGRLSDGLAQAASGAGRAVGALTRVERGSARLAAGQGQAALASRSRRAEVNGLLPLLRHGGLARARRLRGELARAAASDPSLDPAGAEAERLVEALTLARNQAKRAHATASRLHAGAAGLAAGSSRLAAGTERLANVAGGLPGGLERLRAGAGQLAGGLRALSGGAVSLSRHLGGGFHRSAPLQRGLGRAGGRVTAAGGRLKREIGGLRAGSPGIFDSGSFVLSALEGAPQRERERVGQVVDLEHGGQGAKFLVIPRYTFDTPGSRRLGGRLDADAAQLASAAGLRVGVTGGPAQLDDYTEVVSSRVPLAIAAIALATFLVLVLVLRALPLAAIAVALNLLTVAVAFGVLTLLFDVPAGWPLGGRTYVDAIGAAGIFGIVFGLSIDYAVFLLIRMREGREGGADNATAVAFGLRRTARVITGAAAIMVAVFAVFAAAPIATVSQLGVGLTVAVVLDATVVRIVLLPALMLWIGERVWWFPATLERFLPRLGADAV